MQGRYTELIARVVAWCQAEANLQGAILIGSQARPEHGADAWSDLDLMLLADDPDALLERSDWLARFGRPACDFTEVTPLPWLTWNWCAKRVLYDDGRDVDFSLLPYDHLSEVLDVNAEIMVKGYRVLYDARPGRLEAESARHVAAYRAAQPPPAATEQALRNDLHELLFHVAWAAKKARRGELWVAMRCVNRHMGGLLLRLIEAHNALVSRRGGVLLYDGRFLEERTDPAILAGLGGCFARYDAQDVLAAAGNQLELAHRIASEVCAAAGWAAEEEAFAAVRRIYAEIAAHPSA